MILGLNYSALLPCGSSGGESGVYPVSKSPLGRILGLGQEISRFAWAANRKGK